MSSLISYLTNVHFGVGAIAQLPSLLKANNIHRPLLVTDQGLCDTGLAERIQESATATFSEVPGNPDEASVRAGVSAFHAADCDGVIALGGGSPIDCAKAIALAVTHFGALEQYAIIRGGLERITANKPPLIAVPTTAGTGSEVGRAALIVTSNGEKLAVISPHMIPTAAICDPELTVGMPSWLTAATGLDAISHCVETFLSPKYNPVADAIALDGLSRAINALPTAVSVGENVDSRQEMMMAALQGGLTFQKGLGMIHSLSHPMGGLPGKRLHHGTLNAIFLPHVLEYNRLAAPEKIARIANIAGCPSEHIAAFFRHYCRDLGLPEKLSDMGVEANDLQGIAAAAMLDHSTPCNPRPMSKEDCQLVLEAAF
jgi:4-hydroxybutyrate dehydrogenase